MAREALAALSPSRADDYHNWIEVGMGLHSVGDELLPDWTRWSQCSKKFKPGECEYKWGTFHRPGRITLGSLIYWAKEDGWQYERSANGTPRTESKRARPSAAEIIASWLREFYGPTYREGGKLYSATEGRIIGWSDVFPTTEIVKRLAAAKEAPRGRDGRVVQSRLPGLFTTWFRIAWGDVAAALPAEEDVPDSAGTSRFVHLVAKLLISPVTLGWTDTNAALRTERRTIVAWCAMFTQGPSTWQRLRSLDCWAKRTPDGLQIAVRPTLATQVGGNHEIETMSLNKFGRLVKKYEIGESDRVTCEGRTDRAVILNPAFIDQLAPPTKQRRPTE